MEHFSRLPFRIALAFGVLALLAAACTSGTGGTTTPTGTLVTVTVVDTQGRSVNGQGAYQTGDGAWMSLAPVATGTYEFRVPDGETRYGFAVNCPSGLQASSSKVLAYHLTLEEATEILATCPISFVGPATTVEGTYDATVVGGDNVDVYTSLETDVGTGATPSDLYGPIAIPANSAATVVAVAEDASSNPVGVRIARNVNLSSAGTINFTFAAGDGVGSVFGPDWSSSVPGGYSPSIDVSFATQDSQLVPLDGFASATPEPLPTVNNFQTGDLYFVSSQAGDGATPSTTIGTLQFQDSLSGFDADLPDPWTTAPDIIGGSLPTFTNLTALPNEANFRGHMLIFAWSGIPNLLPPPSLSHVALVQFFVSTGWRGSETTFKVPDFTALPGFEGARPLSGDEALWIAGAFSSNLDTATLLTSEPVPLTYSTGLFSPFYPPRIEGAVNRIGLIQAEFTVP